MFEFSPVHLFDDSSQQLKDKSGQVTGIRFQLFENSLNFNVSQDDWWCFCFGKGNCDEARHGPNCFVLNKLVLCKPFKLFVEHDVETIPLCYGKQMGSKPACLVPSAI